MWFGSVAREGDRMYELKLTEQQLKVVKMAMEEYFRVRMGQFQDLSDDLAMMRYDYRSDGNIDHDTFDKFIILRDDISEHFQKLNQMMFVKSSVPLPRSTEEMLLAQDIWSTIRHQLWKDSSRKTSEWCVDSFPPLQVGTEPLPGIRREK